MRKLFITAALVMAFAAPASADLLLKVRADAPTQAAPIPDEMGPLLHNGSLMLMTKFKNHMEIRYEQPRPGMPVAQGTLLVSGQWNAERTTFNGIAFMFKRGCDPAPYSVMGSMTGPGIILVGSPPIRDPHSCAVIGEVPLTRNGMGKNTRLVFEFEPEPGDTTEAP